MSNQTFSSNSNLLIILCLSIVMQMVPVAFINQSFNCLRTAELGCWFPFQIPFTWSPHKFSSHLSTKAIPTASKWQWLTNGCISCSRPPYAIRLKGDPAETTSLLSLLPCPSCFLHSLSFEGPPQSLNLPSPKSLSWELLWCHWPKTDSNKVLLCPSSKFKIISYPGIKGLAKEILDSPTCAH